MKPSEPNSDVALGGSEAAMAADFSYRIASAENVNLRERLGRLEASIAVWASDLDEAYAETQRLRSEVEGMRAESRAAEDARLAAEAERARLYEAVNLRDAHIGELEARIVTHEMDGVDVQRTRSRLMAIRGRVRARLSASAKRSKACGACLRSAMPLDVNSKVS